MEVRVDDTNFQQEVLESDIPALVDFWAPWCMPCHIVAPILSEIAIEYEGKLKVCKLNVDEAPNIASRYEVMSIPTLALFKKGEMVDRIIGAVGKPELENMVKHYI